MDIISALAAGVSLASDAMAVSVCCGLKSRGGYKKTILDYIDSKYPELMPLYKEIYTYKNMSFWKDLDDEISVYAKENDFMYIIDEEPFIKSPNENPIIINYFYHEKIRQSSKKKRWFKNEKNDFWTLAKKLFLIKIIIK